MQILQQFYVNLQMYFLPMCLKYISHIYGTDKFNFSFNQIFYGKEKLLLGLLSEMLGSSRREKGVKLYREFDWFRFCSNFHFIHGQPCSRYACCSKLFGTYRKDDLRLETTTENKD